MIQNELIIGLAGGLGVDFTRVADELGNALQQAGYHIVIAQVAEMAHTAIEKIFYQRRELENKYDKIAYIIQALKNREELALLSNVYGRNFISVAIFCDNDSSVNVKCYAVANYFVYQNKHLSRQIRRFVGILFNDPFAEPTLEEYFMFCAQAAAYRSLDLDRQVGAVIVNKEHELVASGFNDVSKVGGGHFPHHDHPMYALGHAIDKTLDERDFKQEYDFNHKKLDQIADKIAAKLHLPKDARDLLREEISDITEFKRSTHGEMSALLDAARRGIAVRDCTMYINTYPCHNCTKHIMAAGIKKVVFLHPYTKSKAREMYAGMLKHGLLGETSSENSVIFEPFLGVSPNRYMIAFANDKESRLETINGKETGRPITWKIHPGAIPRDLATRQPFSYIAREWAVVHGKAPDMSMFYEK